MIHDATSDAACDTSSLTALPSTLLPATRDKLLRFVFLAVPLQPLVVAELPMQLVSSSPSVCICVTTASPGVLISSGSLYSAAQLSRVLLLLLPLRTSPQSWIAALGAHSPCISSFPHCQWLPFSGFGYRSSRESPSAPPFTLPLSPSLLQQLRNFDSPSEPSPDTIDPSLLPRNLTRRFQSPNVIGAIASSATTPNQVGQLVRLSLLPTIGSCGERRSFLHPVRHPPSPFV